MTQRVLTDEMVAEIKAFIPRYPSKQAVTLPALHVVNQHLRHVPLQAIVEIAEILELAPAQVQDTLSFYGFFKQDAQARSQSRILADCAAPAARSRVERRAEVSIVASPAASRRARPRRAWPLFPYTTLFRSRKSVV